MFTVFLQRYCLFYRQHSGGNRSAGVIVPSVTDLVLWHDAISIKRSVCRAIGVLLVAYWLCFKSGMPLPFSSTLTLATSLFFFLIFS